MSAQASLALDELCELHLLNPSKTKDEIFIQKNNIGLVTWTKGDSVGYQMVGSTEIHKGKMVKNGSVFGDEDYYEIIPQGAVSPIKISIFDIHSMAQVKTDINNKFLSAAEKALEVKMMFGIANKVVVKPYKTLATKAGIEVVADLTSKFKEGDKILKRIVDLDDSMTKLGFDTPSQTRIIINDNPVLPNLTGPFSLTEPIRNVWSFWKKQKIIAMNPIIYRKNVLMDEGVLLHERIHAIMDVTYGPKAFTKEKKIFNEAFADFFAAHKTNNPEIGLGASKNNEVIRDISRGKSSDDRIKSVVNLSDNYHNNSLLVSRTLWELREEMGEDGINKIAKELTDDLNSNFADFTIKFNSNFTKTEARLQDAHNLNFFYAILSRKVKEKLGEAGYQIVEKAIERIGLDKKLIAEISEQVVSTGLPSKVNNSTATELLLYTMAGGTVALEGYLFYEIVID